MQTRAHEDWGPGEESQCAALEEYLQSLHGGGRPDRQSLLARHPELEGVLGCLESLDRLAAPGPADEATLSYAPPAAPAGAAPAGDGAGPSAGAGSWGRYEILEEIGRGGMGVVYKARQTDLGRDVALKMILTSQMASADDVERFYGEARVMARLNHPHVVPIYDVGEMCGQPYLAMKYVSGPTLAARLQAGLPPVERAARWMCQIAEAVEYLHAQRIVHRDLKPGNILTGEDGHPYVTDFGLVKLWGEEQGRTATGTVMGTASYMPPEAAAGRTREVGARSDVYSLGAILYEMLTGRPPFRGQTQFDTLVQVLEGEPVRPRQLNPSVPKELEDVCLRCLEKDPADRYPSAAALGADLEHFLKGEAIEHQTAGPSQKVRRWARREPALAARLVALVVCAAILQVKYHVVRGVTVDRHLWTLGAFALWGSASALLQRLLNRRPGSGLLRMVWSAADIAFLTSILILYDDHNSPVVVCYAVFIAASGLWFRVGLVWFTTGLSLLGYLLLLAHGLLWGELLAPPHHHVIFAVGLIIVGYVVAYQVQRVRALSRYYEQRPLP